MKTNQQGFSAVEAIVAIVIVALVGAGGFLVYNNSKEPKPASKQSTPAPAASSSGKQTEETYTVPDGYRLYQNKEVGFKFYYPEAWGELQPTGKPGFALNAEAPDTDATNSDDTLQLYANKLDTFTVNAVYHGAGVKPIKSGQGYTWQVTEPGLQHETLKVGDTYAPEPKVVFEKGILKVYEFPKGHASAQWTTFVFAVKDTFVAITSPIGAPSIELPQDQFDAEAAKYKAELKKVAESIRLL